MLIGYFVPMCVLCNYLKYQATHQGHVTDASTAVLLFSNQIQKTIFLWIMKINNFWSHLTEFPAKKNH